MFNENSGLVKVWLALIQKGNYTINDIPSISNLREIIIKLKEG